MINDRAEVVRRRCRRDDATIGCCLGGAEASASN